MTGLVKLLDKESEEAGLKKISEVYLNVGELSGIVDECVEEYFELLSDGHSCEGAALHFNHLKARFKCTSCGIEFDHEKGFDCPVCKGAATLIKGSGSGFEVDRIKGE